MKTEETKNTGAKGESTDSGCCNPENFHKMFEKMNKCCIGQDDFSDFSARKGARMKNMMEVYCRRKTADNKEKE